MKNILIITLGIALFAAVLDASTLRTERNRLRDTIREMDCNIDDQYYIDQTND